MEIGQELGANWALFGLLIAFGIGYNAFISWLEREGYIEGYVSLAVAGGTVITLGAVAIIDWVAALLSIIAFACSGTPMIIGSIARHAAERKREQNGVTNDQAPPLAQ